MALKRSRCVQPADDCGDPSEIDELLKRLLQSRNDEAGLTKTDPELDRIIPAIDLE